TQRRDPDRVLEQPAGVRMVVVDGRREGCQITVREHRTHGRRQAGVGQLADEEVEETLQLADVAPRCGRERGGIDAGRFERADVELEPVAESLDAAEDANGVALAEAAIEQLDVVPDACIDASGWIDELERELRPAPP